MLSLQQVKKASPNLPTTIQRVIPDSSVQVATLRFESHLDLLHGSHHVPLHFRLYVPSLGSRNDGADDGDRDHTCLCQGCSLQGWYCRVACCVNEMRLIKVDSIDARH